MAKADKLTPKQEAFALKYVECGNASEAYRHAYDAEKSKPEVVWVNASKVLANTKVSLRVMDLQEQHAERHKVTVDRVVKEMGRLAFSDLRNCLTESGQLKPPNEWDDDTAAAIGSLEVVTKPGDVDENGNRGVEHVHKIKTWDKNSALEKLAKHLGMFQPDAQTPDIHIHMHDKAKVF